MPELSGETARRAHLWCAAAVAMAAALVYLNSFGGVFIYDDLYQIVNSQRIRSFDGIWGTRPLLTLSLAINYRLGGLEPWGYHLVNLAVHVLAALVLFGLVRRTLLLPRFSGRFETRAHWYALAVALIWAVHPLQTQSVTYVIQRAESMMGLFYLLTLYCLLRGAGRAAPAWYAAAVVACAAGMASKPVMVTAPVVALLYDRIFLSSSVREVLRRRWGVHLGLALTWSLLVLGGTVQLIVGPGGDRVPTAGFGYPGCSPLEYVLTQPGVILHYLRLALVPSPLCLDYAWPIADRAVEIVGPVVAVSALAATALLALRRRPEIGFPATCFFIVLAPTSSIVPFAHPAFEHRMYLPLAALAVLAVLGADRWLRRIQTRLELSPAARRRTAAVALATVAGGFGLLTVDRNHDYHNALAMWADVLELRPDNPVAYNQIGVTLARIGRGELAIGFLEEGLERAPDSFLLHNNLANALLTAGRAEEAVRHGRIVVRSNPRLAEGHLNLGRALLETGEAEQGFLHLEEAMRLAPRDPKIRVDLGWAMARTGHPAEAAERFAEALRLDPESTEATRRLAHLLAGSGDIDMEAVRVSDAPIERAWAMAHMIAGDRLAAEGDADGAAGHFRNALAIQPDLDDARRRLERREAGLAATGESAAPSR